MFSIFLCLPTLHTCSHPPLNGVPKRIIHAVVMVFIDLFFLLNLIHLVCTVACRKVRCSAVYFIAVTNIHPRAARAPRTWYLQRVGVSLQHIQSTRAWEQQDCSLRFFLVNNNWPEQATVPPAGTYQLVALRWNQSVMRVNQLPASLSHTDSRVGGGNHSRHCRWAQAVSPGYIQEIITAYSWVFAWVWFVRGGKTCSEHCSGRASNGIIKAFWCCWAYRVLVRP